MSVSLSSIDKSGIKEEDGKKKNTRFDWKKTKELEEARKAGTAPAEVDEEGKDINPHLPHYMVVSPWYLGYDKPTLKHQRPQPVRQVHHTSIAEEFLKTKIQSSKASIKFRKGACENCGAMTHQKKDCLERPRKIGAKYSGTAMASDEVIIPQQDFSYDGKRDRWGGYNPEEYDSVLDEHAQIEMARKYLKAQQLEKDIRSGELLEKDVDCEEEKKDDEKYAEAADMPGQKFDSKIRITVRNLRIREDTAKYLRNLDPDSAYYDPKTRSMRDNPYKDQGQKPQDLIYAGENFVRYSGQTNEVAKAQLFAWEATEKGTDLHLMADPTRLAMMHEEFKGRKKVFDDEKKDTVMDKYGGEEHMDAPPRELIFAQTEEYREYSRSGDVIKGQEREKIKSKYEEDVYPNNHTSVWGSYWLAGHWGFRCCQSTVRQSYCVGKLVPSCSDVLPTETPLSLTAIHQANLVKNRRDSNPVKTNHTVSSSSSSSSSSSDSSSSSSSDSEDEADKLKRRQLLIQQAIRREELKKDEAERILRMDERKRPYNSMLETATPTEVEMEAYRLTRQREDDPMAAYMSKKRKDRG